MVTMNDAIKLAEAVRDVLRPVTGELEANNHNETADNVEALRQQAIQFLEDAGVS